MPDNSEEMKPVPLSKVTVVEGDASPDVLTAIILEGDRMSAWTNSNAVSPPYDPDALLAVVVNSSVLPQCVEGMVIGCDGFGHRLDPVFDTSDREIKDKVRAAIILEREADADEVARERKVKPGKEPKPVEVDTEVAEQEINDRIARLERETRKQMFKAEAWFEECCTDYPFEELRRRKTRDREQVGQGAIEISRDSRGDPETLGYIPGHTIYPVEGMSPWMELEEKFKVSPISSRVRMRKRRFRTYVQVVKGTIDAPVYFKQFGDPRTVSRITGKAYKDPAAMKKAEPKAPAANELLYFPIHSPSTVVGVPRWVGQIRNVEGMRAAEETNYLYFDNKSVPVGAWICENGTLGPSMSQALIDYMKGVKGRDAFHRSVVIELAVEPHGRDETPPDKRLRWESFMSDQRTDAAFLEYCKACRDQVGSAFRLPPLLRGEAPSELTRANSYASLEFAEQQVFAPERRAFDWVINKYIMPSIGCELVKFTSKGPVTADAESVSAAVQIFATQGGLVPGDVRKAAAQVLSMDLPPIEQDWVKQPLALTLAGYASALATGDQVQQEQAMTQVEAALGRALDRKDVKITRITPTDELLGDIGLPGGVPKISTGE